MSVVQERIEWPAGHSFRLLRWQGSLHEIDLILAPVRAVRINSDCEHWHYHPAFELTFFESGQGTRFIGDRIQPFRAGDLVFLGPNLPHHWQAHGESSGWSVQWEWDRTHHLWAIPEMEKLRPLFRDAARGVEFSGGTAQTIASRLPELAKAEGLDRLALLLGILAVAAAAPANECAAISRNPLSFAAESRHQAAIQAAIRFLLENFRRPIRLEEILSASRMSRPTFSRQFKTHAGKTVSTFLQQIRLEASAHELAETDRTVTDIAIENGFSVSFFNRLFRRVHECSPLEYRLQQRNRFPLFSQPALRKLNCAK